MEASGGTDENVRPRPRPISHSGRVERLHSVKPFQQVVEEYAVAVLRVCRAVVGPLDADDAWSETFLSALKAYPELAEDANIEAWLVTIAHRKALDVIRARMRLPITTDAVVDRASTIGIPAEYDHDLWAALRDLPDKQRHAVAYHYLAGMPHKEIADLLGGTADAARRAAADGIKALRGRYPGAARQEGEAS